MRNRKSPPAVPLPLGNGRTAVGNGHSPSSASLVSASTTPLDWIKSLNGCVQCDPDTYTAPTAGAGDGDGCTAQLSIAPPPPLPSRSVTPACLRVSEYVPGAAVTPARFPSVHVTPSSV